jgi:MarR family transcriptional regulator for hemolysin
VKTDLDKEAPGSRRAISLKMTVLTRQLHKRFDQAVVDIGVTRSQWTLIAVIARRPAATQREIAEVLEMSEAAAGRLIDRLCADAFLERRPKEDDRRAYCIHLTSASEGILEKISAVASVHEKVVFEGFSEDDLKKLDGYLSKIAANIAAPR